MKNKIIDISKKVNPVSLILILFFIADSVNFFIDRKFGLDYSNSVTIYVKGLIEIVAIIIVLYRARYKNKLVLIGYLIFVPCIVCLIEYYVIGNKCYNEFYIVIKESNKYVFNVILFLFFNSLDSAWNKKVKRTFESIFLFSAGVVIVAYFLDIEYLYTYGKSRFGFKPLLSTQNEITYFWMIGITYFAQVYFIKRSLLNLFSLFTITIAGVLLGTKAILLFVTCFIVYAFIYEFKLSIRKRFVGISIMGTFLTLYLYSSGLFNFFYQLYKEYGVLYAITSKRNVLIQNNVLPVIDDWKIWNYFFGGNFKKIPLVEMDLIDAFFFFGIIGIIIYFYLLMKTIFRINDLPKIGKFFFVQFIIIGSLAGHLFSSGINAVYVALLFVFIQYNKNKVIPEV